MSDTPGRDIATLPLTEAIEAYTPQFADALPDNVPLQRFKRTVLTALNRTPELARCDRRSFFLACVKCAHDGLYPDGREAELVAYGAQVQYLPMIAGIRKRMRNSGEVLSAVAEVVHRADHFRYVKGDESRIEHEPPDLDKERGDPIGAYAIIKLANGEVLREVMSLHEIERVRAFSRNANGKSSPWVTSWGEMARKTALRRCSKAAPISSELDRLLMRDDEIAHVDAPPPPKRGDYVRKTFELKERAVSIPLTDEQAKALQEPGPAAQDETPQEPETSETPKVVHDTAETFWAVIDADGEEVVCTTADAAEEAIAHAMQEGARRGRAALEAAFENNEACADTLSEDARMRLSDILLELRTSLETPSGGQAAGSPSAALPPSSSGSPPDGAAAEGATHPETVSAPSARFGSRPDRSFEIEVPVGRGGKGLDYRAWWIALLPPALRKAAPEDRPWILADNDASVKAYYASLQPAAKIAAMKELDDLMKF